MKHTRRESSQPVLTSKGPTYKLDTIQLRDRRGKQTQQSEHVNIKIQQGHPSGNRTQVRNELQESRSPQPVRHSLHFHHLMPSDEVLLVKLTELSGFLTVHGSLQDMFWHRKDRSTLMSRVQEYTTRTVCGGDKRTNRPWNERQIHVPGESGNGQHVMWSARG